MKNTAQLEKGLIQLLKMEKCKFNRVTVDIVSVSRSGTVLEYVIRANEQEHENIRRALLKHHPTMIVETMFKFVKGVLVV